jgi:Restriction endonuclease NaeI
MKTLFPQTDIREEHRDFKELQPINSFILRVASQAERKGLGKEFPPLVRELIDEVLDTPRTGRLTLDELEKTEKTYLGTKVEIVIRDFLGVPKGIFLDLLIDGVEVDVKNTVGSNWSIPNEAVNQVCLLVGINERENYCYLGLIKARLDYLTVSQNQDGKRGISAAGKSNIMWLLHHIRYPANFWAQFSKNELHYFHDVANVSPNERLARLFRHHQRKAVPRNAIQDVARQLDSLKRVRANGGARDQLAAEGIAILSGEYNRDIRMSLGFSWLRRGEYVSIKPETDNEHQLLRPLMTIRKKSKRA